MAVEPIWLTVADIVAIHREQLRRFGGLPGTKDENLVGSAVAAPRHLFLYDGEDDVLVLAVRLALSLAKNHGFADGNKRTATAAMIEFLAVNGYDLAVPDDDAQAPLLGLWIEAAVAGSLSADGLRRRLEPFVLPG